MPFWNRSSGSTELAERDETAGNHVLETGLRFEMVDFFSAEADEMIRLGLAKQKSEVNWKKFYRISAAGAGVMKADHSLLLANARVICDGKIHGLGCSGVVAVTHGLRPSDEGLLLKMKGPLDALSKWQVACTCGTTFLLYADATVGKPTEGFLIVVNILQPQKTLIPIAPFFEAERVDVVRSP